MRRLKKPCAQLEPSPVASATGHARRARPAATTMAGPARQASGPAVPRRRSAGRRDPAGPCRATSGSSRVVRRRRPRCRRSAGTARPADEWNDPRCARVGRLAVLSESCNRSAAAAAPGASPRSPSLHAIRSARSRRAPLHPLFRAACEHAVVDVLRIVGDPDHLDLDPATAERILAGRPHVADDAQAADRDRAVGEAEREQRLDPDAPAILGRNEAGRRRAELRERGHELVDGHAARDDLEPLDEHIHLGRELLANITHDRVIERTASLEKGGVVARLCAVVPPPRFESVSSRFATRESPRPPTGPASEPRLRRPSSPRAPWRRC